MRRVDLAGGREIGRFDSVGAFVKGVSRDVLQVVVISVKPGGRVGRHPTGSHQLFLVVSGGGWVSGGDGARVALGEGEAVAWEPGEEHESGSDKEMVAVVVEADALDV